MQTPRASYFSDAPVTNHNHLKIPSESISNSNRGTVTWGLVAVLIADAEVELQIVATKG